MEIEYLRQRPYLTGLLIGLPVWLIGYTGGADVLTVALLFLGTGVVLAVYGDGWYHPAGKALAAAGATLVLAPFSLGFFGTLA